MLAEIRDISMYNVIQDAVLLKKNVAGLPFRDRIIIDIAFGGIEHQSHAQDMIDHDALDAFVFRVGQGLYHAIDPIANQIKMANNVSRPYGLYYAFHPWYKAISQVDRFMLNWQGAQPKSIWTDFELHGIESAQQRNDVYHACTELIKARTDVNIVVGNYTGRWVVDAYMPMAVDWLAIDPLWNASYVLFQPTTWAKFHSMLAAYPTPVFTNNLPVDIWQFAGDCMTPMIPHRTDYNVIRRAGVFEHLFQGAVPPPAPLPIPPFALRVYEVVSDFLTVNSGPGMLFPKVYYLTKGAQITVRQMTGTYGNFATGRWANCSTKFCKQIS